MGLLQQIAVKAYYFAKTRASGVILNARSPEFEELRCLVDRVTLKDCNFDADRALFSYAVYENETHEAPCFAAPIYEDEFVHMSIFGCRAPKGYIPLHDHKGMHGFLKVLHGQGRVQTFTRTDECRLPDNVPPHRLFKQRLAGWQEKTIFPTVAGDANFLIDPASRCCVLTPDSENLHFVQPTKGQNLIFFDLLTPPYLPGKRDCHYFTILEPNDDVLTSENRDSSFLGKIFHKNQSQTSKLARKTDDGRDLVWLARCPPPDDYFCDELAYNGEKIDIDEEIYVN